MLKKALADFEDSRAAVRERYGAIARERGQVSGNCCLQNSAPVSSCCGNVGSTRDSAALLGYSEKDIAAVPEGADLGLGCGTPLSVAALRPGETVLDLGSGAGFDCFLAARELGSSGQVIGVDMTVEMVAKARRNAMTGNYGHVDFRLGEIEYLPVADSSVDVIISNCVINLSPDKPRVFREAFRVLKPGGRVAVADIVRSAELPQELAADLAAHCGCVAGAASVDELETMLREAGFTEIRVRPKDASREFIRS